MIPPIIAVTAEEPMVGVAQVLDNLGVPYASTIGAAITFVVVFVFIYYVGKLVLQPFVDRALNRRNVDQHAKRPIQRFTTLLVIFVAITVAFGFAGYGDFLQSLATVAAAATLAIGFALQDVIQNFVSGIFIYTDKPFRMGDWIEWDGHSGVVEDISLRVTRIRTFDNELLTVPNKQLTDNVIKNPVNGERLRLKFTFGIGYDEAIEEATRIIIEEAEAHEGIMDDPAPSVRVTELADSSVGLQARIWIENPKRSDFVRIKSEYVQSVKERLDEAGIDIPYPQRVLHGDIGLAERATLSDVSEI